MASRKASLRSRTRASRIWGKRSTRGRGLPSSLKASTISRREAAGPLGPKGVTSRSPFSPTRKKPPLQWGTR